MDSSRATSDPQQSMVSVSMGRMRPGKRDNNAEVNHVSSSFLRFVSWSFFITPLDLPDRDHTDEKCCLIYFFEPINDLLVWMTAGNLG